MTGEFALLARVVRLAADPELDLRDFIDTLASSPRLAGEVVRIASSPLHGMAGKISRLDRATLILGARPIAEIAAGVIVADELRTLEIGPLDGARLWVHSLETAIACESVARALDLPLASEAYLAGLLHDLGIASLCEWHGRSYAELVARAGRDGLDALERRELGCSHAERSAALVRSWGFPETLAAALGAHHANGSLEGDTAALASCLRAAHWILRGGEAGFGEEPALDSDCGWLGDLGLHADDAAEIAARTAGRLKEAAAAYRS